MSSLTLKELVIVAALCGVNTLNTFLSGALTVAIPTIGKELGFQEDELQWPVNVNSLSYGCLLLFFGRLGDIVGSRTVFLAGSAWFAAWSIGSALAPNKSSFILFAALEGLGSACNTPASISIISAHFLPGKNRNIVYGALGAAKPVGYTLGLVLSGFLTQSNASWRAIFYIQAGLGFFFVGLGWFVLLEENSGPRYAKGLDWGGAFFSTAGLGMLTYSITDSTMSIRGWHTPQIPTLFSISILFLAFFVWYERRREARGQSVLLPMSMWRPGSRRGCVILLVFFGWWCFDTLVYFATLYFQQISLLSPLQTAIRFLPLVIAAFITNVATGYLMGVVGGQTLIVGGLLMGAAAPLLFALIKVDASYWAFMFPLLVLICGIDISFPVGNLHVASTFDDDSQSLAGGVFNVATRLGVSIGLAVTTTVANSVSEAYHKHHPDLSETAPEVLMPGFRAAGWTCFGAAAVTILVAVVGLRGIVPSRRELRRQEALSEGQGIEAAAPKRKSSVHASPLGESIEMTALG